MRPFWPAAAQGLRSALPMLVLACACARASEAIPDVVVQARELAGASAQRAHQRLGALRLDAMAAMNLPLRLFVDEADCRVLSDSNVLEARRTAQEGLAAARAAPLGANGRLASLRLRACLGGVQLDLGEKDAGSATLEQVLAESSQDDGLDGVHSLALLERGLHRSRSGELLQGQRDLLIACQSLEALGLRQDLELCRSHLANHYKRMGDTDEAARLLQELLEAARRRGAQADVAVYVFGLAQVLYEQREWDRAAAAFTQSADLAKAAHDASGLAYALHGLGHTALQRNNPAEALDDANEALEQLGDGSDPLQQIRTLLLKAEALHALGRTMQAHAILSELQPRVRDTRDDPLLADWLALRSPVLARLGLWREAYEASAEWRPLNAHANEQKTSQQSARMRLQFNRERDVAELVSLRKLNAKGDELVQAQRLALFLFLALLALAVAYSARKMRHARHLQRLALVDELSGLPNRRATLAYLEEQCSRPRAGAQPLAVLMVDVDHFKRINDRYGHAKGDDVLRLVARTLGAAVRQHDRAGRLGGEEFLVVLPGTSMEHALAIAERMRIGVEQLQPRASEDPASATLTVTVSIGAAAARERDTVAKLLGRADEALYAAKHGGRNRVHAEIAVATPPSSAPAGEASLFKVA